MHLKPCPQCEAVNDSAAEQCYECGAPLEPGNAARPLSAAEPTIAAAAAAAEAEPRHVPESLGVRLKDLPPLEGGASVGAAERREAFARSRRKSAALFAVVVLLGAAVLGYFGYRYQVPRDAGGTVAAASAPRENPDATTAPRAGAMQPSPAAADASGLPSGHSASGESTAAAKPADAPAMPPAQPTPPAPNDVAAAPSKDVAAAPSKDIAAAPSSDADTSTNVKPVARPRSSTPRTESKSAADSHSRPATANEASAIATQRMIERYLGVRAGAATQRATR